MSVQFGNKVRELREQQHLLQRQVASLLDMDTPLFSRIERGERTAKREVVTLLAKILRADTEELLTLWLADQIVNVAKDEDVALKAIQIATAELTYKTSMKK